MSKVQRIHMQEVTVSAMTLIFEHQRGCRHESDESPVRFTIDDGRLLVVGVCESCGVLALVQADPSPTPIPINTVKALHKLKTGEDIDDATARELAMRDSPEEYD